MRIGRAPTLLLAVLSLVWQAEAKAFFFCFNLGAGGSTRAQGGRYYSPPPPPLLGARQFPPPPYPPAARSTGNPTTHLRQYEVIEPGIPLSPVTGWLQIAPHRTFLNPRVACRQSTSVVPRSQQATEGAPGFPPTNPTTGKGWDEGFSAVTIGPLLARCAQRERF